MGEGLRMVHLRTVPDAWHAKVLAARLGSEGIVTQLRGSVSGPYPFGAVSVLVEEAQAELAAELLLADEVEAAFAGNGVSAPPFDQVLADGPSGTGDDGTDPSSPWAIPGPAALSLMTYAGTDLDLGPPRTKVWPRWRRAVAAAAALLLAGAPVLAHFVS
jgi:hypothetical protein